MNEKLKNLLWVIFILVLSSCSSYKKMPYFQDLDAVSQTSESIQNYSQLKIQVDDVLDIKVSSSNSEALKKYDLSTDKSSSMGYKVDASGMIKVPLVGSIAVNGLTTSEAEKEIEAKLKGIVNDAIVNVRIMDFKISVLGDVDRPGVYPVQTERITTLEALSLAGDLNITADRDNVLLIREKNGKREFNRIDLTSKKVFESPYFYLQKNDVLYVKPSHAAYTSVERGPRIASLALSAVAVLVSVGLLITR